MAIAALNWAWHQQAPTSTAKLVLVALADHANADGECWPSMASVAALAQCSTRQVSRCIDALEDAGLLTRRRLRKSDGQLGRYSYKLAIMTGGPPGIGDQRTSTSGGHVSAGQNQETPATSGHRRPVDTAHVSAGQSQETPATSGHPGSLPPDTGVRSEPSLNHQNPLAPAPPTRKPRRRDPIFDALVDACGLDPGELTKSARGALNAAVKQLRDVDATPDEIATRGRRYRKQWPDATLTPTALAKNYAQLGTATRSSPSGGTRSRSGPPVFGSPEWEARERAQQQRAERFTEARP